ncbi:hypothetical protein ElyMa_001531200 [Elysia marginata]|uniref:Uncharacterized protein n=1 Tax=Elysia marginata TaxID=1093978 RepID=A0AAV4J924_9GAST|nr:hypothetical protein ElyMa_001531200 [Elysia marginata]
MKKKKKKKEEEEEEGEEEYLTTNGTKAKFSEQDLPVRVGVCLPKGATFSLYTYVPNWKPTTDRWNQVDSVEDLEAATIPESYYWDEENG